MMGQILVTNPRYVLVVSGGCFSAQKKKYVIGSWTWVFSCLSDVQKISLELMTLFPVCEDVETSLGVPLTVTATAQVKIMKDRELLQIACEQFLGYEIEEIEYAICSTLEGHLRSILGKFNVVFAGKRAKSPEYYFFLGTLTVEEAYKDREKFASLVREVASPDVGKMGVEIISFTIKDITDKMGYLTAMGKTQIAAVKRDANIGVAISDRDAGIKEAEAERQAMDFKYIAEADIAKNTNAYKINLSEFEKEIQAAKAEVFFAYDLQASVLAQKLKEAQIGIDIMERKKKIEVEKQEVSRKELALKASVRLPAEAEGYKVKTVSEGQKNKIIAEASGEAEKIKLFGDAEAFVLKTVGSAEAFRMSRRAEVFKNYKEAAKLSIIFNNLPKLAAELSAPLSKIDEMLLLGDSDDFLGSLNKLLGKIPHSVRTVVGVDIANILKNRLEPEENEVSTKKPTQALT